MQKVKNSIGESIRKLRKSQEISKSELAEITGISSSHMNKIELGIRNPSVVTCQKMLIALNASIIEYYGAAEPPVRCGESHLSGLTEPPHFVY